MAPSVGLTGLACEQPVRKGLPGETAQPPFVAENPRATSENFPETTKPGHSHLWVRSRNHVDIYLTSWTSFIPGSIFHAVSATTN